MSQVGRVTGCIRDGGEEGSQMKDWPIRTRYRKKWAPRHAVGTVGPEKGKNSTIRDPENVICK
jgi:hypothetical protein